MNGSFACIFPATGMPNATAIAKNTPIPTSNLPGRRTERLTIFVSSPPRPFPEGGAAGGCAVGGAPRTAVASGVVRLTAVGSDARGRTAVRCASGCSSVSVVLPTLIESPERSSVGASMRLPLTNVPLLEPRSSMTSVPSTTEIRACSRESSGSSPSAPAPSGPVARPNRSGSVSTAMVAPAAGPAATCSVAVTTNVAFPDGGLLEENLDPLLRATPATRLCSLQPPTLSAGGRGRQSPVPSRARNICRRRDALVPRDGVIAHVALAHQRDRGDAADGGDDGRDQEDGL